MRQRSNVTFKTFLDLKEFGIKIIYFCDSDDIICRRPL